MQTSTRHFGPRVWTLDGRYLVVREMASGGMGTVFEAEDVRTGRMVAVKVLHSALCAGQHRARLLREARTLGVLAHPGIVKALDAGADAVGRVYIVMERLDGASLEERVLARGTLPVVETLSLMSQVCDALAYAHARGVVHRDIKPGNVIVTERPDGPPRATLVDFGIALQAHAISRRLTAASTVIGTPAYMAPEQWMGDALDARCDVFAAALTCVECLVGCEQFTVWATAVERSSVPLDPRQFLPVLPREVPAALLDVLNRALDPEPVRRGGDAAWLGGAFARIAASDAARAARATVPFATAVTLFAASTPRGGEHASVALSASGMRIAGEIASVVGDPVGVRFALPGSGQLVTMRAVVRTVSPGSGFDVEFRSLPGEVAAAIVQYISHAPL